MYHADCAICCRPIFDPLTKETVFCFITACIRCRWQRLVRARGHGGYAGVGDTWRGSPLSIQTVEDRCTNIALVAQCLAGVTMATGCCKGARPLPSTVVRLYGIGWWAVAHSSGCCFRVVAAARCLNKRIAHANGLVGALIRSHAASHDGSSFKMQRCIGPWIAVATSRQSRWAIAVVWIPVASTNRRAKRTSTATDTKPACIMQQSSQQQRASDRCISLIVDVESYNFDK
jgi:hypothetical protein